MLLCSGLLSHRTILNLELGTLKLMFNCLPAAETSAVWWFSYLLLLLKTFLSSFSLSIIVSLSLFINNPCNVRWVYVTYTHFMMLLSSGNSDVVFRGRKSISIFIYQGFRMTRRRWFRRRSYLNDSIYIYIVNESIYIYIVNARWIYE